MKTKWKLFEYNVKIIFEIDIGEAIRSIFESVTDYFENFSITDPSTWFGSDDPENKFMGGSVAAGKPYMVGERGAELFVPGAAGTIIPNGALGGGSLGASNATLAPKVLEMSFDFNVLHSHPLGYDASSGKFRSSNYPYGSDEVNTAASRSRLPPASIRTNVGGPPTTSGPEAVSAAKGSKVLDPS